MNKSYLGAGMAVVMGSLFLVTGVASAAETTTPSWDPTLIQAKSCAEVEGVFKEYFMSNRNGGSFGPVRGGVIMNDAATREALSADGKGAGGGAGDFSQTNNQKTGVDEPDVIKNDGKYIYYVDANSARKIHIVAAATAGRVEASISLPQDVWGTQIFLHKGMLIVVGGKAAPYAYNAYETSMIARDQKATVMIYDITNPKAPKLQSAYEYDGYIQESRVVDGKLVLITSQSFTRGPVYMMRDKAMQTTTSQTIKPTDFAFTSRQLLPSWTSMQPTTITYRNGTQRFTTAKSTTQVDCTNVLYKKPDPKGNTHYGWGQSLTSIITFSLDTPRVAPTIKVVMGNSSQVHVTKNSLYLTSPSYVNIPMRCPINARCIMPMRTQGTYTTVHQFSLPTLGYNYSTAVKGTTYSQYSMDESNGIFRIVTSDSSDSMNRVATNVYTIDGKGKAVGKLERIAPGEQFHGVRFIDNYLYLVTYRQIDPLFVINMSDVTKPTIIGQLKMPGYSAYLHPYGPRQGNIQYLIGLGFATSLDTYGNERQDGIKLDLYKIDFAKKDTAGNISVVQAWTKTLGGQGSQTEAMYNPRMFMFNSATKELLLPLAIARTEKSQQCTVVYDRNGVEIRKDCYPQDISITEFAGMKGRTLSPEGLRETISIDYKESLKYPYNYGTPVSNVIDPWILSSLMPRVGYMGTTYYFINTQFAHLFSKSNLKGVTVQFPQPSLPEATPPPMPVDQPLKAQ